MYERRIWRGCWIYKDRYYTFTYSSIILRVSSMHYLWSLVSDVSSTKVNEKEENWFEKKNVIAGVIADFVFPRFGYFFPSTPDSSLPNQQTSDEKKLFGNDELRWWRSLFFPFFVKRGKRGSIFLGEWKLSSCCFLLFGKPSWWNILTRVE